ncbi:MAG: histidine kinase [Corynebacterium striatum]|uniref:sensor histidine kinase n=1 Tax=Corynebacterium simulans TaxID=146827 RepID=UPI0028FE586C|nr:histidine kinase [Corynebacterium striatum]
MSKGMTFLRTLRLGDVLLAGLAVLLALLYTLVPGPLPMGIYIAQAVVSWAFVPFFAIWRSRPALASAGMIFCLGVWALIWFWALPVNSGFSPWLVAAPLAIYSSARLCESRWIPKAILGATFAGTFASPLMWKLQPDLTVRYRSGTDFLFTFLFHWLLLLLVYVIAVRLRDKELERQARQREAQEEERLLIARELHDVLAHSLTLIKVQANAGLVASGTSEEALRTIRTEADGALAEVRSIVSSLRAPTTREPSRQLSDIPKVVEGFRAAGLDISADLPNTPVTLPALTQLALVRIITETLTNVLRHQGVGATVRLKLSDSAGLSVESWGRPQGETSGAGVGLVGIAERANALGGFVRTSGDARHFLVEAQFPRRTV